MNGSDAVPPSAIVTNFPGHAVNGVNLVIVNATNSTNYICVSLVDNVGETDSEPVHLYVAGMCSTYISKVMCAMNIV